jgi:hypothetical protein
MNVAGFSSDNMTWNEIGQNTEDTGNPKQTSI